MNLKPKKRNDENLENVIHSNKSVTTYNHLALLTYICVTKFGGYPQL